MRIPTEVIEIICGDSFELVSLEYRKLYSDEKCYIQITGKVIKEKDNENNKTWSI